MSRIDSVSYLIKKYELTLESYLECAELFNPKNAIVLTETEHRHFHKTHGRNTTQLDWLSYKEGELNLVSS